MGLGPRRFSYWTRVPRARPQCSRVGAINGVLPGGILLVIVMIAVLDGSDDTAQEVRSLVAGGEKGSDDPAREVRGWVAAGEKRHRWAVLFGCLAALAGALLSLAVADKL